MPVLGHAVVGILAAQAVGRQGLRSPLKSSESDSILWMPALVVLSYLPDIVTQLGFWAGFPSSRLAGHSLPVGILAGLLIARAWAGRHTPRFGLLAALVVGTIVSHDLLDLLQDEERSPFWPFSSALIGASWIPLRNRLANELLLFGVPFAAFELTVLAAHVRQRGARHVLAERRWWVSVALVCVLLVAVGSGVWLRGERQRRLRTADRLLRTGQYAEALRTADDADRWPWRAGSGRLDVIRGDAYEGLGNLAAAEMHFLRAYEANPDDFRAMSSLAEFWASYGTAAERRNRAFPLVETLRTRFPRHPALAATLRRIERKAAQGT